MAASMGMGREMIDWTKPIETVDGRGAKVLSRCYWTNGETYCVVQVENPETGNSEIFIVNPTTGYGGAAALALSSIKIRNVRVKRVAWCLVSPKYCIVNRREYYRTEELAKEAALPDERIARMEWEE